MTYILWFLAYVGAALSAANAAWYGLSASDPGMGAYLSAAVLAFVAVLAVHGLAIGAHVWRAGHPMLGTLVAVGLLTCFIVTLGGGMGTIVNRAAGTEAKRTDLSTKFADDRAELARIERERAGLPAARPSGTVAAEIAATKRNRLYDRSEQCTNATATSSRKLCATIDRLGAELAAAYQAERLDARAATLRDRLHQANPETHRKTDAPATAMARLLSIDPGLASALYAFSVSLALELGAMLAMLAAELTSAARRRQPLQPIPRAELLPVEILDTQPEIDAPQISDNRPMARVDQFVLERLIATEGDNAIDVAAIHTIYCAWADKLGCKALSRNKFESLFIALCGAVGHAIERRGKRRYAIGLKMAA